MTVCRGHMTPPAHVTKRYRSTALHFTTRNKQQCEIRTLQLLYLKHVCQLAGIQSQGKTISWHLVCQCPQCHMHENQTTAMFALNSSVRRYILVAWHIKIEKLFFFSKPQDILLYSVLKCSSPCRNFFHMFTANLRNNELTFKISNETQQFKFNGRSTNACFISTVMHRSFHRLETKKWRGWMYILYSSPNILMSTDFSENSC